MGIRDGSLHQRTENWKCDPLCLTPLGKDIARTRSLAIVTSTNRAGGNPAPVSRPQRQDKSRSWGNAEQSQQEAQAQDLESDTAGQGGQEGKEGLWGWFWSQQPRLWFPWSSSGCMGARHLRQHRASSICVDPLPLPVPRGAGPPSYHTGLQCLSVVAATRAPPHPVLRSSSSWLANLEIPPRCYEAQEGQKYILQFVEGNL